MSGSKSASGFTMHEVLVVLAILCVLAAIAYPVFQSVRRSSYRTACISNLRQAHTAITLYRIDQGKDGVYGSPEDMGLPGLIDMDVIMPKGLGCNMPHPLSCSNRNGYMLLWPLPETGGEGLELKWTRYVQTYQESAMMISDAGHSQSCPISGLMLTTGLGLTLQGAVRVKSGRGDPSFIQYYH